MASDQVGGLTDAELFPPVPVYGPGSIVSGKPATPDQAAYAAAAARLRDPKAPAGTPQNPSYDTPDLTGAADSYHVTPQGRLSGPAQPMNLGLTDHDVFGTPTTAIDQLPTAPAMAAALADQRKRQSGDAGDPGSLNLINGFMLGFAPEFDAGAAAVDTAGSNLIHRVMGQPVPYGASDAYSATAALDRSALRNFHAEHPVQSGVTGIAGTGLNPATWLGGSFIADAPSLFSGSLRAAAVNTPIGAAMGAGEAGPGHRLMGALNGGAAGAATGAIGVPVFAGLRGAGVGAANMIRRSALGPQSAIGEAIGDMTPAQMAAAQSLRTDMAGRGVNISLPEAVQQVTGNGTAIGRVLRVIESTKRGEQLTAPYFADRPNQVMGAVNSFADTLSPPSVTPSVTGLRANDAATRLVLAAEKARTDAAQPFYDAANPQNVPVSGMAELLKNLDAEIAADKTGILGRPLGQLRGALTDTSGDKPVPVTDVANLDRARKFFRDRMALPQIGDDAITKEQGARLSDYLGQIDNLMEGIPAFRAGKRAFQTATHSIVEPVAAGPLGKLAATTEVPGQTAALYPAIPLEGQPAETGNAIAQLEAQRPGLGGELTRQYISQALMKARPELQGGPNPYLGSSFGVQVAGNPLRQANLAAGVQALPGGADKYADLMKLIEGLRATGKRQPVGSKTAFNSNDIQDMGVTGPVKFMQSLNIAEPLDPIAKLVSAANYRRNVTGLASAFMSLPEDTASILARAKAAAPTYYRGMKIPRFPMSAALAPIMAAITARENQATSAPASR